MNEKIRELKEQARDFYLLQEDLDCSIKELHELVDIKFAELIVRECAQIARGNEDDTTARQIESRFGVEK